MIDCDAVPEALVGADVVYATPRWRKRMTEEVLVTANVSGNLLNKRLLAEADASDIIIMHPLPRDSRMDFVRSVQRRGRSARPVDLPPDRQWCARPDGDLPHHTRLLGGRGEGDHRAAPGTPPCAGTEFRRGSGQSRLALVMASTGRSDSWFRAPGRTGRSPGVRVHPDVAAMVGARITIKSGLVDAEHDLIMSSNPLADG